MCRRCSGGAGRAFRIRQQIVGGSRGRLPHDGARGRRRQGRTLSFTDIGALQQMMSVGFRPICFASQRQFELRGGRASGPRSYAWFDWNNGDLATRSIRFPATGRCWRYTLGQAHGGTLVIAMRGRPERRILLSWSHVSEKRQFRRLSTGEDQISLFHAARCPGTRGRHYGCGCRNGTYDSIGGHRLYVCGMSAPGVRGLGTVSAGRAAQLIYWIGGHEAGRKRATAGTEPLRPEFYRLKRNEHLLQEGLYADCWKRPPSTLHR